MKKRILVSCECEGTGFVAVADNGGEGVEHVECGQHHPAFKDAPSVDELHRTDDAVIGHQPLELFTSVLGCHDRNDAAGRPVCHVARSPSPGRQ